MAAVSILNLLFGALAAGGLYSMGKQWREQPQQLELMRRTLGLEEKKVEAGFAGTRMAAEEERTMSEKMMKQFTQMRESDQQKAMTMMLAQSLMQSQQNKSEMVMNLMNNIMAARPSARAGMGGPTALPITMSRFMGD